MDLPDADAGRVVSCSACGAAVQVPAAEAVILTPVAPPAGMPPPPLPYSHIAQSLENNAGMRMLLPVGRSGWAIAAGYLGLISVLLLPAPLALLISIVAMRHLKRHPDKHGLGRAIFGLVMGIIGTIVLAWFTLAMAFGR